MLPSTNKLEVVSSLKNDAVVGGNVKEESSNVFLALARDTRRHLDFLGVTQDCLGDGVADDGGQMRLIYDSEDFVGALECEGYETAIL